VPLGRRIQREKGDTMFVAHLDSRDLIGERDGKAYVDKERCHGCGQCFLYCPPGAAKALRREHHHMTYCAPDLLGYD